MVQNVLSGKKSSTRTTLPKWGSKIFGGVALFEFAPLGKWYPDTIGAFYTPEDPDKNVF